MPDEMEGQIDDPETPRKVLPQIKPPPIERNEYGESGDEGNRNDVQKTKVKPEHWTKYVEVVCGVALVLITGYYAYFAARQWETMNQTYGEIRKQTCASQSTLGEIREQTKLLRQQVEETNAASVSIGNFGFVAPGTAGISLRNLGHYAATDVKITAVVSLRDFPTDKLIATLQPFTKDISRIAPPSTWDADPMANRGNIENWTIYYHFNAAQVKLLKDGAAAVTLAAKFSYSDGFKVVEQDAGCFGYLKRLPLWSKNLPDGHIQGSGSFEGEYPCEGLAEAMKEALDWEAKNKIPPH